VEVLGSSSTNSTAAGALKPAMACTDTARTCSAKITNFPQLRFHAQLDDGAAEVRFERVAMSYILQDM
jgi:hypothetical protein